MKKKDRIARKARNIARYYFFQKQDYIRALGAYKRAVTYGTALNHSEAMYHQLSSCYFNLGDYDKALQAVELGLCYSGGDEGLQQQRYDTLLALGEDKKAQDYYEEVEKIEKNIPHKTLEAFYNT